MKIQIEPKTKLNYNIYTAKMEDINLFTFAIMFAPS